LCHSCPGHRDDILAADLVHLAGRSATDNCEDADAVSTRYLRDAIEAVLAGGEPSTSSTAPKG
jgi:hypothetical protein